MEKELKTKSIKDKFSGYIFFDFESREDEDRNQLVNLAIAKHICVNCLELDEIERCLDCKKIHKFSNIKDFLIWSVSKMNTVQIAHNLKGYDGVLILDCLIENMLPNDAPPNVISNGTKLLSIKFKSIKYIDSA